MLIVEGICVLLTATLNRRGLLQYASGLLLASMLAAATFLLCAAGEGSRDVAVMIFPAVVAVAGVLLRGRLFLGCVVITALCLAGVISAEINGVLVAAPRPISYRCLTDAMIILGMTALAIGLLLGDLYRSITAAQESEAALRESEERLKTLAEASFEGIAISDHGLLVDVSDQLAEMLGYQKPEMIGKEIINFVAPSSRAIVAERVQAGFQNPYEHELQKKDSSVICVESRARTLLRHGTSLRVTVIRDITNRKRAEMELRKINARLNGAVDLVGLGFYERIGERQCLFHDERIRALIGIRPEEVDRACEWWEERLHPDDRARVMNQRKELEEGRTERASVEYRFLHPQKGLIWISHLAVAQERKADGTLLRSTGVMHDITERKRAEEELIASRSRLEAALEAAGMGSYQAAAGFRIFALDDRTRDIFGIIDSERILEVWTEHIHADDRLRLLEITQQVEHGNRNHATAEYRYQHPNRGIVWIRHSIRVLGRDARGGMTSLVGAVQDITDRKRAEEALQRQRNTLNELFEHSPGLLLLVDPELRVLRANREIAQRSDVSPQGQKGSLPGEVLHCLNAADGQCGRGSKCSACPVRTRIARTLQTQERIVNEEGSLVVRFGEGQEDRHFLISTVPVHVEEGPSVLVAINDNSDRKRIEHAMREYNVRLRSLAAQLALAEETERRKLAAILHDNIGQDLAVCNIRLGALESQIKETSDRNVVRDVGNVIRAMIERTRSLTFEISPRVLYDLGLKAALSGLCESTQRK
ncbi:MAG TPA: PAS domain-containing protein, partial [Planctomycetota bacterium]